MQGTTEEFDAVVVGAGIAGLYMLHELRGQGLSVRVYEAGDGIGGTWFWNRYPGARCDVESMEYSYSFSPELEQEWEWTEKYPTQPEILRYLEHVADRFDLRRDVVLGTRVRSATYDGTTGRWTVETEANASATAQFCIMATGCLSTSKTPEIPGLETFQGPWYHTGRWPHDGVEFHGRRVGVVGTGSSGIQVIPLIAEQADQLTVFQRTPNFAMPAGNRPLDPAEQAEFKAGSPEHRQAARESNFGIPVPPPTQSALEVEASEREQAYQAGWDKGSLVSILASYTDTIVDRAANDTAAEFVRNKIREAVHDPATAETLCPYDHPFGTKRPCLDTNYFATFNEPHVTLVDVRRTPLQEITPTGIRTSDQEFTFDALVFATGFDAMTGALTAVDIRGRDGVLLRERWTDGPRAYLGLGVAGFPNLFTITGPGSPSVLSNMMVSIEQHVEWVSACVAFLRERGHASIEPAEEAQDAWVQHVQEAGDMTLYPTADSWYMGANVEGKARVFMPYVGGVGVYRQKCDDVAANGYEGFLLTD